MEGVPRTMLGRIESFSQGARLHRNWRSVSTLTSLFLTWTVFGCGEWKYTNNLKVEKPKLPPASRRPKFTCTPRRILHLLNCPPVETRQGKNRFLFKLNGSYPSRHTPQRRTSRRECARSRAPPCPPRPASPSGRASARPFRRWLSGVENSGSRVVPMIAAGGKLVRV